MARKKIVFIIVEGPSDDEALGLLMEKFFERSTVFVHITHGDVTSELGIVPTRVLDKVGDIVKAYAKSNHLVKTHFQEIIHIVDMDGAFIPDNCVIEDLSATKPVYSLTTIHTANVKGLQHRNEIKRQCLSRLSMATEVWGVPYQTYYMSCNLDHVLHNKQNSTDDEKERDALRFAKKYRNDLEGFIRYISKSDFSIVTSYVDSWSFIKQDLHSLERYTNLGICLGNECTT